MLPEARMEHTAIVCFDLVSVVSAAWPAVCKPGLLKNVLSSSAASKTVDTLMYTDDDWLMNKRHYP